MVRMQDHLGSFRSMRELAKEWLQAAGNDGTAKTPARSPNTESGAAALQGEQVQGDAKRKGGPPKRPPPPVPDSPIASFLGKIDGGSADGVRAHASCWSAGNVSAAEGMHRGAPAGGNDVPVGGRQSERVDDGEAVPVGVAVVGTGVVVETDDELLERLLAEGLTVGGGVWGGLSGAPRGKERAQGGLDVESLLADAEDG